MKQDMRFNLFGNVVAVYYQEKTETYLVYQMCGRKKYFIDEVDGIDEAARVAIDFCFQNA